MQCHSLYDLVYGTDILKPQENNTVTMILFEGNHSTLLDSVYNFGSPENSHTLHVKADSQSSKPVVINELIL